MPSFNVVNYSLRPNKGIQRSIVFEGLQTLQEQLGLRDCIYIGFGSIWFTDFVIAHKMLNISSMISIEANDIGCKRANFNRPFRTVQVEYGMSTEVLTKISLTEKLNYRHWIVWLDYDGALDETVVEDLRFVIENAPPNSVLITTFNANGNKYGRPKQRAERIRTILGEVVPEELSAQQCDDENIATTLAKYVGDFMTSSAIGISRPGGFEKTFSIQYRDGASMVTVGGVLPTIGAVTSVRHCTSDSAWGGCPSMPITAPLLTLKEAAILQAQLPRARPLNRKTIQKLGFDLEEDQIKAFERFYKYYPSFAQISI